jgi:hypothetical protein
MKREWMMRLVAILIVLVMILSGFVVIFYHT